MGDNKYIPLIIESNDADPIKYYSTSASAKYCEVTKQTLDYTHRNRCTRIVENRKWGFWRKLPLFDHFCGTPTQ